MSNPLIEKYFEIYPEKKEKPKKVELEGTVKLSEEQMDIVSKYLTTPNNYSTTSVTGVNPNSVSATTAANHIPKLTSYDTHSAENYFLEVAEKIKNKNAKVTSITLNSDRAGLFTTGMTTVTFEVQVYDIP